MAGRAPHDAEPAQGRGLLKLGGQVLEQARGRDGRLQLQPCDQPVNDHMGEPFDLGVDGSDRLVRELFGGTGEIAHALINPSVTLEAGMMGLESSVKWRGTDKVGATSLALPRVYARCLPEDALAQVASRQLSDRPARPKLGYGQRHRAHGGTQLAAWPARLRGCRAAVCAATSRLDRGEARSPGQPVTCNRRRVHEELRALEDDVQRTGIQARLLLGKALHALARGDLAICDEVISGDDEVDQLYLDIERRILHLFALQTPVASDLRLLTALLHSNLDLERIADQAVNMAKITKLADGLPPNPTVLQHLEEMGAIALRMVGAAMAALARRDLELACRLRELDDPLDRLNRGMLRQVLAVSDDKRMLEWGIRMYVVSRQIERIGDNAVDIGEQVAFLVTGEFREFTDASHPEIEHPELLERGGSPDWRITEPNTGD